MKYDVNIDINTNDSHAKILKQINEYSTILEFGCANGRMTQYMKQVLSCDVYIVEYDEDMFTQAIPFAKDGVCGDIMHFEWTKWQPIQFDYILFDTAPVLDGVTTSLILSTKELTV